MHQEDKKTKHIPVLLDEVLKYLDPREGESYLDLTAGYGGHASVIMERTKNPKATVLVDRDKHAIKELNIRFKDMGVNVRHQDFYSATKELEHENKRFDVILADLGVSSPHLNEASRGFTFQTQGPLDMRMDQTKGLTAADVVNGFKEADISDILSRYGQEPKARLIAKLIVENRPFSNTSELASVVAKAWPGHSKVHPATRTFQAIRIAVNDELGLLEKTIPLLTDMLNTGGRLAVISFHSLEDRMVKQALAARGGKRYDSELEILTKSPITASPNELVFNPRARSAKLRAAVKINT